ncbi:MAG: translocation/assembly module TamB domain-containing protein [Bacteroidia bacterium]|nr:translocation/assembly module TamB domain-containing protein [Bacteroidia bacterium]
MKRTLRKIGKITGFTLLGLVVLILLLVIALQFTWVQNQLVPTAEKQLSKALGTPVFVGTVGIDFPAKVTVNELLIEDSYGNKFASLKSLKVSLISISLWRFIFYPKETQHITISAIDLVEPDINIYKGRRDSTMNIAFLSSGAPKDSTKKGGMSLDLHLPEINLIGGKFSYSDSTKSDEALSNRAKLNYALLRVQDLNGEFGFRLKGDGSVAGDIFHLEALEAWSGLKLDTLATHFTLDTEIILSDSVDSLPQANIFLTNARVRTGNSRLSFDSESHITDAEFLFTPEGGKIADVYFRPSRFDFEFMKYVLTKKFPLTGSANIKGKAEWGMSRVFGDSLQLSFGKETHLNVGLILEDYTDEKKLKLGVEFRNSRLNFEELVALIPSLALPLSGTVGLNGRVAGNLKEMISHDLQVFYRNDTRLYTDFVLNELESETDLKISLNLKSPTTITLAELKTLMPDLPLPDFQAAVGRVGIVGNFTGQPDDFSVNADLTSQLGNISASLELILPPKVPDYQYNGKIVTHNFAFDQLGISESFKSGNLSFDGRIEGTGFQLKTMNATFDGIFTSTDFFGYEIDTLRTVALNIRDQKVNGGVQLRDKQGNGNLNVKIDLGLSPAKFVLRGDVKSIDLSHYDVGEDSLFLSSIINVDLQGDSLDNMKGKIRFLLLDLEAPLRQKNIVINNLEVRASENTPTSKEIEILGSMLDGKMKGNFSFNRGIDFFSRIAKETRLYLGNKDSLIQQYYAEKILDSIPLEMDIDLHPGEQVNDLLTFLEIPVYISPQTVISCKAYSADFDQITLLMNSDSLEIYGAACEDNDLTLDFNKEGMTNSFLAVGNLNVGELMVNESLQFSDINFEPSFDNNVIEYWLKGSQPNFNNSFRFRATTTLEKERVVTLIDPKVSKIVTGNSEWVINKNNSIIAEGGEIKISKLQLHNGQQDILIDGDLSKSFEKSVTVSIREVPFSTIREIYRTPIDMDGKISFLQANISGVLTFPRVTVGGRVSNFRYQQIDSVDMNLFSMYEGNPIHSYLGLRTEWSYRNHRAFQVKGIYDFSNKVAPINFEIDSANIPLRWANSITEPNVTDFEGHVSFDDFTIKGSLDSLEIEGEARFQGDSPGKLAAFHVEFFNKTYGLGPNSVIKFNKHQIEFPQILIYDSDSLTNVARLNGSIKHSGFKDFQFFLDLDSVSDFSMMNTRKKDNDLFYGNVILANGIASITGKQDKIEINADVYAGKGSMLSIPLNDYTSASRLDFVHFVGSNESAGGQDGVDLTGFKLNMRVNVDPGSKVRLIFDEQVGDIIEAQGDGNLQLEIDDEGDFVMRGDFEVDKGDYLFTAKNVVNKKFKVEKGSRISWSGDPYEADLDITAVYKVNANIGDLLGGQAGVTNRIPVDIIMKMTQSLSTPHIALSLKLQNVTSDDVIGLESYFRNIQYDEQELNRQVVSLLVFGRFASSSYAQSDPSGGVGITNSISELVTNQVNYWLSQAFKANNLGVQISTNEFEDIQLGLRAQLFGDKVTIERNGTIVGNETGQFSMGNISVLIKLLPATNTNKNQLTSNTGQLVLEIFNRESTGLKTSNTNTTGVGVFFKKDFDNLRDLFGREGDKPDVEKEKGKKKKEKKEKEI